MKRSHKMPRGVREGDKLRISVVLDKQVFDDVCTFALNRGWSFSEAINDLAKCGILDMKDAEEFNVTEKPNDSNKPGDSTAHS